MKKIFRILLFLPLISLLVACGAGITPKDQFISRLESQQSEKQMAYDYTFHLEDISSSQGDASMAVVESFVGKEIKASVSQDLTSNVVSLSVDLSIINPALSTVEMIYADDRAYISAAPFLSFYGVSGTEAEGKYLDLAELFGENMPKLRELSPNAHKNTELYKEIDAKKFKKEGDKVSLTLTLDELLHLAHKTLEKGGEANKEIAEDFKKQMETAKRSFSEDSTFVMTMDKKKSGEALLHLKSAENKKDAIHIKMTFKQKAYQAPILPNSSQILSQQDLFQLMGQ